MAVLLLGGCAAPAVRAPLLEGLRSDRVAGEPFLHLVYANAALREGGASASLVNVYLDGDGRPWAGASITSDPSPRGVLVLRMLQQDSSPALYLGRPCHFVMREDSACAPQVYSFERYGPATVASLAAALHEALRRADVSNSAELRLIGYSGGGVLAMLLANQLAERSAAPRVREVLTVAANLDVAAWVALHRYSPLEGSLDPARQPPLPRTIRQLHLVGSDDRIVPPAITRAGLHAQSWAEVRELAQFDHRCCWLRQWPAVLRELAAAERDGGD